MEKSEIIISILQLIVTVLGFIITFILSKKEFKENIKKIKTDKQIEKTLNLQRELFRIIDSLLNTTHNDNYDENEMQTSLINIINEVKCFGSNDSVKIAKHIVLEWYRMPENKSSTCFVGSCLILISQLKYDTIGVKSSPRYFLEEKYEFDQKSIEMFANELNPIITKLNLKNVPKVEKEVNIF